MAFIGAGVTALLRYPTWPKLLEILATETRTKCGELIRGTTGTELTVTQVMGMGDMLVRAEIFKFNLKNRYFELMEELFGERHDQISTIQDLIELPFRHLLTTNYDPGLELAHIRAGKKHFSIQFILDLEAQSFLTNRAAQDYDRRIVHVHGWYGRPHTIVLTESDYGGLYGKYKFPDMFWDAIAIDERCVFFGFSFTDEDVMESFNLRNFNRANRKAEGIKHYALVAMDDDDKEPGTRESLRLRYGIEPVFFRQLDSQFSGYSNVLRAIVREVNPLVREPLRRDVELLQRMTDMNIKKRFTGDL